MAEPVAMARVTMMTQFARMVLQCLEGMGFPEVDELCYASCEFIFLSQVFASVSLRRLLVLFVSPTELINWNGRYGSWKESGRGQRWRTLPGSGGEIVESRGWHFEKRVMEGFVGGVAEQFCPAVNFKVGRLGASPFSNFGVVPGLKASVLGLGAHGLLLEERCLVLEAQCLILEV
jgi:hypothetical protein